MSSRRDALRRLFLVAAGAGLSLVEMASLSGCREAPPPPPISGRTRDDRSLQREMEVPPGIPEVSRKGRRR
jgi:hypothetical protein